MRSLCAVCLVLSIAASARADESVRLLPAAIELTGRRDFQTVIVQQTTAEGVTRELREVELTLDDPRVATLDGKTVFPLQDGQTMLRAQVRGTQLAVPVVVRQAGEDRPLNFRLDVMPVFSKTGCNAGRCHGASRGKDGFQLSLYGFDPDGDHYRLTEELLGRRINLSRPTASLLLTKATGEVPHSGGQRFAPDSTHYQLLKRWIEEGAEHATSDQTSPTGIEIFPAEALLAGPGEAQQLVVRANYSDGTSRDVTHLASFLSNNGASADISESGRITAGVRGEAFVMARFAEFTEGIPVITLSPDHAVAVAPLPANNEIDQWVNRKLGKLRIQPAELCTDEQFIRRASIDLAGITPSREQFDRFINDPSPHKRERLVDELLQGEAFVDLWTMKFGELLKIRTANQVSYKALLGFHNWLRQRIDDGAPLNQVVHDVVAAEGGTFENPPTNYFQIEANRRLLAENVAQSFLGMRIQCAQCHNHPFDRWTMDDYYGFTAFFSQIGFKQSRDPREYIVHNTAQGEVRHIVDQRIVQPKFLGAAEPDLESIGRRQALARWIADDEAGHLARHLANVIWAHHFGRGIIEPVDDVRISNPPSNPLLLDWLANRLRQTDYDLRALVREICLSRTYQMATATNPTHRDDERNFSHAAIRRIRAEVLLDSISQITQTADRYPRLPPGSRSMQIADGAVSTYFLSTFGRATRETVCSCEVDVEPNLSQAFHLLNGETTNDKILAGGLVQRLVDEGKSNADIIAHLYISCFSRRPSARELDEIKAALAASDSGRLNDLNDLFWALLNSKEFIFNH